MPSKKKKYNARFPAGRIKKIMQTDEDVGKVAQAVPIIISRTLELFVHSLLTKTMQITSAKRARTLSPFHMKQCILSESRFDFLKDLVKGIPDVSGVYDEVPTPPLTPAPTGNNLANNTLITVAQTQSDSRTAEDLSIAQKSMEINSPSKDCVETINTDNSIVQEIASPSYGQVPNFQISMPSSFNIGKPNFYTEVNPINLSCNQIEKQATSSFSNSTNIDEDYDT
ncbi:transcription regulator complex subunit bur6 [Chelonus insularis]|uniref:transcription regulator complex subunit bur6 n=1 Tax=Chelonus insularis TaxID=460826 RepID=UPI00158DBA33|nr:transcription regulator complex subunit bur6 [Chelonus insularis]